MKELPLTARLFVGAVLGVGALLLVGSFPQPLPSPVLFLGLLACSAFASALKVTLPLPVSGSTMSVSYAVDFASLLLLGTNPTMIVAAVSGWSQCTFRTQTRPATYRTLYSIASLVLTVKAAGLTYTALGGVPGDTFLRFAAVSPLLGAATVYFICNTVLVATAVALSTRQPIARVWHENFLWSAPSYFAGAGVAALATMAVERGGYWTAAILAAPLFLIYRSYKVYMRRVQDQQRHVMEVSDLHLATIEALALAIDAKDRPSPSHLRRLQAYAAGLARALGMSEEEVQGVKTAALLHDIGKLAIPEHILSKPGPLTQEEFEKVRIHPQVGADIVKGVPFPYAVAPLIVSHHERWDGKGYPAGLSGEQIPLGARILSVVDYFDALISDRPYHKAISVEAALGLVRQERGKGLDPRVVDMFITMHAALAAEAVESSTKGLAQVDAPTDGSAFEDIALAHREIYALYEIAQAMGSMLGVVDTMSLIATKLNAIVPYSCCALFLNDDAHGTLRCRFACGVDAELLQDLTVRTGQGLAGWVARNHRPLVNARPALELEAGGIPGDRTSLQSALVCPLVLNDRFIGTISVYHTDPSKYTNDHRRLLDRISEQAAAVINNSMVFEQTQEDSLTDPLTALPNTRSMFMHLTRELARAERLTSEVSLLVLDLDNFKEINDTYGHHIGDRALREIATVLRNGIRPYDICVRYAGDEFVVVLAGCGAEEAERKRLELQREVDRIKFEGRPGTWLPLSISAGAAIYPHDGTTYEALLATADSRMYRDKTRRKRFPGSTEAPAAATADSQPAPDASLSDSDLRRSATGVL